MHSLIFQLSRDDSILQDFVCETNNQSLASNLVYATDLLIKLLNVSGFTHIVVDGLDEIEESQRRRFLVEMLRVLENCPEARILISSRDEHDIEALLKSKSADIRADTCNLSSIQTYVTTRYKEWIQSHTFTLEEQAEIKGYLDPIARRAEGESLADASECVSAI